MEYPPALYPPNNLRIIYACGKAAAKTLRVFTNKVIIKCISKFRYRYKHLIAICYGRDININAWLVKQGLAIAYAKYSSDYIQLEFKAKQAKRGLWASFFNMRGDGGADTGYQF